MLKQSISNNALLLAAFALATTFVIAGTYLSTQQQIKSNIRQAQQKALLEIVPDHRHNNSLLDDNKLVNDATLLGLREASRLFIATMDADNVAAIIPATARDGYTGDINLIVGVNVDGSVAGVRVLSHRETPGLGDAIDLKKSDWVLSFNGKSLANTDWRVKKDGGDFDQFTGATITPRAVTNAVKKALQYFAANQAAIFAPAANTTIHTATSEQP
ncbi:electron transport complex subunit RsxG [Dasania sp. GY-MA-18]|uniref:Ion-translocating oxidoreductase complex subunit G n=1 Tax=Dasania phycosphaerae TaxID=2950436 RepID=A0A9J6RQF4_9GAMM|nr:MULTISPECIES: electron transport complex subunit RsxG [Dasania]MCR8923925.1 electron transport complex subunit RsxG [Dasania sp. GY-MA-18]MCZ0866359.1 electron transport complex subunit RsxG [Dasania phycosphaerae]MCZ0870083.1 electron transport complex subunit RsxG [Dasania phycosphaerae]